MSGLTVALCSAAEARLSRSSSVTKPITSHSQTICTRFPGIGLGALACQAKHITDEMIYAAARGLALTVTDDDFENGRIFPKVSAIPRASIDVAMAVCKQAKKDGMNQVEWADDNALREIITARLWTPSYGQMIRVDQV